MKGDTRFTKDLELMHSTYGELMKTMFVGNARYFLTSCCTPLHEECSTNHGQKEDPRVTPKTCGTVGGRAALILLWMRAMSIGNASHPRWSL